MITDFKQMGTDRRLAVFLIGIFIFTLLSGYCYPATQVNIRVCVASGKDRVLVQVKGHYKIEAINSDLVLRKGRYLKKRYIKPTISGLMLGDTEFKIYGIRIVPKKDATIFIDKMRFRGIVDIMRTKKLELTVINHLDIEKYLYGVLQHEVPYYWPMEAVKAQAIAARTFALYRRETMRERDYDVTSDIYSQVYGGRARERWRSRRAVDLTKGKFLVYERKVLPAYYHSMCGGHTENAKIVFDIDLLPLKGRPCPYCKGAAGMYWKAAFSYKDIEKRLKKYGINLKGINFIVEGKRDASGRLKSIKIRHSKGVKEIKGYKFRLALGPNVIRSTNFTIRITPKGVMFRGKGWGHGVGMCQWGAFGMAKRRFNYKAILKFYYPGAEIKNYAEVIRF